MLVTNLLHDFQTALQVPFVPPNALEDAVNNLIGRLGNKTLISDEMRKDHLFAHVNSKFNFNSEPLAIFFAFAAKHRVILDYHAKKEVSRAFDYTSKELFLSALKKPADDAGVALNTLLAEFNPIGRDETRGRLTRELASPTLTRKDSKPRDWSEEILSSLYAAYAYSSFPEDKLHAIFDPLSPGEIYQPDFWTHLHKNKPDLFSRKESLACFKVKNLDGGVSRKTWTDTLLNSLADLHERLANHGYLALYIDQQFEGDRDITWEVIADITLYAEKHKELDEEWAFISTKAVAERTRSHVSFESEPDFSRFNFGYFYKDCFIIGEDEQRYLLLFQKNWPDETLVPCPTCRSHKVQGNSYSSIGVKSWECNNPLCPDRSKFNRGKRYSFLQLLKQQGLLDLRNIIPKEHVKKWVRDVQPPRSDEEVLEFLVRHYSLHGDGVSLYDWSQMGEATYLGRALHHKKLADKPSSAHGALSPSTFFDSVFFERFIVARVSTTPTKALRRARVGAVECALGDSFEVLQGESEQVDGAVTSPPYYNAREYSQWPNIYAYLYDMYNCARAVFRILKPGQHYLFNIFDYFDNESILALSAMGNKRMILGAYAVDFFRRAGFQCIGNVIWDKGEIEGKRGFNQGNFTPYYQAPFNCWEHVFVFRKPGPELMPFMYPKVLKLKPVFKMVRGENIHGHTAPYPEAIPALICGSIKTGGKILDPYAGSMTTGSAAIKFGARALCIELDPDYFALGVAKLNEAYHP